jgi:hypothetical protein
MSGVVRVPDSVLNGAKQVAGLRGCQAGDVLAEAWAEYFANHQAEFANDLEEAARLLRTGTLDDLAAFLGRNNEARAEEAAARLRSR